MGNLRFPLGTTYHGCPRNAPVEVGKKFAIVANLHYNV